MNLKNHHTHNTIGQYLSVYIYFHHFENQHHFEFESIKNEFFDPENLLKHELHIEILQNLRHTLFYIFLAAILKRGCHFGSHH